MQEEEGNILIHGDNLPALKSIEEKYREKVRCIYIDPPYNTRQKFSHYNDSMSSKEWLNMMKERLAILKNLLRDDGTIWISIDDGECHYLKVLCDEIFGRKNFVANVVCERKSSSCNNAKWFSHTYDHMLVYAKCKDFKKWDSKKGRGLNLLPRTKELDSRYKNPNNDPRGAWNADNLSVKRYYKSCDYPIQTPSGRIVYPPKGGCWRVNPERLKELILDDRIYFGPNGNNKPSLKRFLSEVQNGKVSKTIWLRSEIGDNQEATKEEKAFSSQGVFPNPKPERLIRRILELSTDGGDLVLDSFAGSGTTGAVAHKMGRRWIMIEKNDCCITHIVPRLEKIGSDYEFTKIKEPS